MEEYVLAPMSYLRNVADTIRETTGSSEQISLSDLNTKTMNAIAVGGGSGAGIIDVVELPTQDIKENSFYRLLSAKFVSNYYSVDGWMCRAVNGLPDTGVAVSTDMVNITAYYNTQDNGVYGYVDSNLSYAGGIPVGWYPIATLAQVFNVSWGGVITDIDNMLGNSAYLLLSYDFYIYKNGWSLVPFAYESHQFDIQWDGVIGDRFALDMSLLGFSNTYFVKVSDEVFTVEQLIGATARHSNGDTAEISSYDLDTTTYAGAIAFGSAIVVVHSSDDLSAALGLPAGYVTNGIYFVYIIDEGYVSRLVAPPKITKIDSKFINIDKDNIGLHSVAFSGNYNDLYGKPTVYTDVVRYNTTQSLSSTYKANARTNIDVYSKSEVDTKIAGYAKTTDVEALISNAIGTAIGGSY